jgi:ketosteroid isomerase-like protein
MNTLKKIALLLVLVQSLSEIPALHSQHSPDNQQSIIKVRSLSNEAFKEHDLEGIARQLVHDVTIITASGRVLSGKDSVVAVLKKRFEATPDLVYQRLTEQIVISKSDTLAWEKGRWTAERTGKPSAYGNYAATWCNRKGIWFIRSELFVQLD